MFSPAFRGKHFSPPDGMFSEVHTCFSTPSGTNHFVSRGGETQGSEGPDCAFETPRHHVGVLGLDPDSQARAKESRMAGECGPGTHTTRVEKAYEGISLELGADPGKCHNGWQR